MFTLQVISLMMSIGGVCMVAVFSTRGEDYHYSESSNSTSNSSAGDEPHNTVTGIMVLAILHIMFLSVYFVSQG